VFDYKHKQIFTAMWIVDYQSTWCIPLQWGAGMSHCPYECRNCLLA